MVKNYYPQAFPEEWKYIAKERKISKFINDELEHFSNESDYSDDSNNKKTDKAQILKPKYKTSDFIWEKTEV